MTSCKRLLALLVTLPIIGLIPPVIRANAEQPLTQQGATTEARPANWATPLTIDGAPNLNRVTLNFYRSAQPTTAGFQALAKDPGIKTVVSLRSFHSDAWMLIGTNIKLVRVPMNTWHLETEDVIWALAAIRKAEITGKVLLHCQHGADRTGLISALYRVVFQGWSKDAALEEMQHGSFGYHAIWGNIPRYLKNTDVAVLKSQVEAAMALQ